MMNEQSINIGGTGVISWLTAPAKLRQALNFLSPPSQSNLNVFEATLGKIDLNNINRREHSLTINRAGFSLVIVGLAAVGAGMGHILAPLILARTGIRGLILGTRSSYQNSIRAQKLLKQQPHLSDFGKTQINFKSLANDSITNCKVALTDPERVIRPFERLCSKDRWEEIEVLATKSLILKSLILNGASTAGYAIGFNAALFTGHFGSAALLGIIAAGKAVSVAGNIRTILRVGYNLENLDQPK